MGGSNAKFLTSKEMKTAFLLLLLLSFAVAVFGVAYFQYCSLSIRWMMVDWLWPMDLCRYCACVVAREEDCSQFLRCTQLLRLVLQLFQTCFFLLFTAFLFHFTLSSSISHLRIPNAKFRTLHNGILISLFCFFNYRETCSACWWWWWTIRKFNAFSETS